MTNTKWVVLRGEYETVKRRKVVPFDENDGRYVLTGGPDAQALAEQVAAALNVLEIVRQLEKKPS